MTRSLRRSRIAVRQKFVSGADEVQKPAAVGRCNFRGQPHVVIVCRAARDGDGSAIYGNTETEEHSLNQVPCVICPMT